MDTFTTRACNKTARQFVFLLFGLTLTARKSRATIKVI